jgi:hypothetical protein
MLTNKKKFFYKIPFGLSFKFEFDDIIEFIELLLSNSIFVVVVYSIFV